MRKSVTASLPEASAKARRLQKLASVVQAELGKLLTRELELPTGTLVTITRVEVQPDYKVAHVKVSILPFDRAPEVFAVLLRVLPGFQHQLNGIITMFHAPKVVLELDQSPERTDKLERLLDSLKA